MASSYQELNLLYVPAIVAERTADYERVYEANRHRVYSLAFWMTDNELVAEQVAASAFVRAFAAADEPTAEMIDRALLAEVRELVPVGPLTLACRNAASILSVRRNIKRIHMERAVVQLPATERMIFLLHDVESYDKVRIARLLGMSHEEVLQGLHQARLGMRESIAEQQ